MGRSWKEQMKAETDAMRGSAEMAETITHYPLGVTANGLDVDAYVFLDHEEGTNEDSGDGAVTQDNAGDRERRTGLLEVDKLLAVDDRDTWLIDGQLWFTERHYGRDSGLRGVRIVRGEGRFSRRPRMQPNPKSGRGG